jgi:hypothetical protein
VCVADHKMMGTEPAVGVIEQVFRHRFRRRECGFHKLLKFALVNATLP